MRLGRDRRVQGDEVGAAEEVVERAELHPGRRVSDVRVVGQDPRLERDQPGRDLAPDRPQGHETDRAPTQLDAGEAVVHGEEVARARDRRPPALPEGVAQRPQVTGEHQEERERQVGDRIRVAPRGVEDGDALARRQLEVDVDRVAAAAADHLERHRLQHLGVHQVRLHDQHVGTDLADAPGELGAVEVDRPAHLPVLVHHVHVARETRLGGVVEARRDEGPHGASHEASRRCTSWVTWRRTCSRSGPLRTLPPRRLWYERLSSR